MQPFDNFIGSFDIWLKINIYKLSENKCIYACYPQIYRVNHVIGFDFIDKQVISTNIGHVIPLYSLRFIAIFSEIETIARPSCVAHLVYVHLFNFHFMCNVISSFIRFLLQYALIRNFTKISNYHNSSNGVLSFQKIVRTFENVVIHRDKLRYKTVAEVHILIQLVFLRYDTIQSVSLFFFSIFYQS